MDLLKLAVEDAMFVQESYAASQAVVKMPAQSGHRLAQLKALIELVQSKDRNVPEWLSPTILAHNTGKLASDQKSADAPQRVTWLE